MTTTYVSGDVINNDDLTASFDEHEGRDGNIRLLGHPQQTYRLSGHKQDEGLLFFRPSQYFQKYSAKIFISHSGATPADVNVSLSSLAVPALGPLLHDGGSAIVVTIPAGTSVPVEQEWGTEFTVLPSGILYAMQFDCNGSPVDQIEVVITGLNPRSRT